MSGEIQAGFAKIQTWPVSQTWFVGVKTWSSLVMDTAVVGGGPNIVDGGPNLIGNAQALLVKPQVC